MYGEYGTLARRDHSQARERASMRQRGAMVRVDSIGRASVNIIPLTVICANEGCQLVSFTEARTSTLLAVWLQSPRELSEHLSVT